MAKWDIRTQNRNGNAIGLLRNPSNRKFEFLLNRPSTASFTLALDDRDANRDMLAEGEKEFTVERLGEPVETVFALTNGSVNASSERPSVSFNGLGISSYLMDALVYGQDTTFSGTALPWTWINTFQSRFGGSYGITQGPVSGVAPTRYKNVKQDAELLQTIVSLSQSSAGFDFAIDTARRYCEWHTARGASRGLVLEYGVNVLGFNYETNVGPGQIVTDVRVFGPEGWQPRTASAGASVRSTYGRREATLTYPNEFEGPSVTGQQLQHYADAAADDFATPLIIPSITIDPDVVPWGTYDLGDTVRFKAQFGQFVYIDTLFRIIGIIVTVDNEDNEAIDLVLNIP